MASNPMITSTLTDTTTQNPYTPFQSGLGGGGGLNFANLIRQLAAAKQRRDAANAPPPNVLNSTNNLDNRLERARANYEMERMDADLRGPSKVLVPTGYGHMLQEDVSSMPFSMRPGSTEFAPTAQPGASASLSPSQEWSPAENAEFKQYGPGLPQTNPAPGRAGGSGVAALIQALLAGQQGG